MRLEYEGYTVTRTGLAAIWKIEFPDGTWRLIKPTDDWTFEDETDFYAYIDVIRDKPRPPMPKKRSLLKRPK